MSDKEKFGHIWRQKGEAFWKGMWAGRISMHNLIANLALGHGNDINVMEVGCGFGYMRGLLSSKGHVGSYAGVDISPVAVEKVSSMGCEAHLGNFMEMDDLKKVDVTIVEGVLDHQDGWKPMSLKALELSDFLVVGLRRWQPGESHSVFYQTDYSCYDTFYSKELFLKEAQAEGLKVNVHEYLNRTHNRPEVVLELSR